MDVSGDERCLVTRDVLCSLDILVFFVDCCFENTCCVDFPPGQWNTLSDGGVTHAVWDLSSFVIDATVGTVRSTFFFFSFVVTPKAVVMLTFSCSNIDYTRLFSPFHAVTLFEP